MANNRPDMEDIKDEAGESVEYSPRARSADKPGVLRRFGGLFSQPASAITDQGFFALGNFAVSTILARQMSKGAFGQFSAAFAAFLLLSTIYCAFVVDPMLVYGVSRAADRQRSYVRNVISLHWRIAFLLSVVLLGVGLIRSLTSTGAGTFIAYIGWALAAPAVLRLWLARRTTYLIRRPQYAALAGGVYLIVIVAMLFAFGHWLTSSVIAPCLIIASSSIVVGLSLHRAITLSDRVPDHAGKDEVLGSHWTFGRWASIAGILGLLPDYIYFFVLSPENCGEYRALLNVVIPLIQAYNALGVLLISYFARNRERANFMRTVIKTSLIYAGAAITFAALALTFGGKLFGYLYGGKYDLRFTFLLPLAIVSVLFALKTISDALLRSLENVSTMAGLSVVGAIAAVACGVPLALRFGVAGAVYGDLSVYCIATCAIGVVWFRRYRGMQARRAAQRVVRDAATVPYANFQVTETPFQSFTES